jgi:hypothetical protein
MHDGFSFDPNFAYETVPTLRSYDPQFETTLQTLQTAMTNFMTTNDGDDHMDHYQEAQKAFHKGHDDHKLYLQNGYNKLEKIIEQYHYNDQSGAQGFGGALQSYP